jgi:hypothetical protein
MPDPWLQRRSVRDRLRRPGGSWRRGRALPARRGWRTPAAVARSISPSAISGLVRAVRYSTGTPARFNRTRSFVQQHKTKKGQSSSAKDFLDRYHAAYALIYDKGDYQAGITARGGRSLSWWPHQPSWANQLPPKMASEHFFCSLFC